MGIPRLSQDIQPYTDRVVLGQQTTRLAADTNIHSLIIDGPSVVYFIYNKLLAWQHVGATNITTSTPTYKEINQATHHFLDELSSQGVEISKIFFDGGLPESKRDIRLLRMERLRQQLEACRKVFPDSCPISSRSGQIDVDKALWTTAVPSARKHTQLPAPPFMVASVIESLRGSTSRWRDRIQTVPGEADLYCALAAKESGAAILTNDSDLAVHDLGSEGRIVLLQSIQKETVTPTVTTAVITALALNPTRMAERLDVTSLLRFGFERSIDHSLSVSLVRERARDESRLDKYRSEYALFAEQYVSLPSLPPSYPSSYSSQAGHTNALQALNAIDPRTAELVTDYTTASPHIYLTPLVEDPSRDSSWSYGAKVRQLAYSLLEFTSEIEANTNTNTNTKTITEYARKGPRIAATTVTALSRHQMPDQINETLTLLDEHLDSSSSSSSSSSPLTTTESLLTWYTLAFRLIYQHKEEAGKTIPPPPQILRVLGLTTTTTTTSTHLRTSWDDIHLLANAHAVLYSFRMLKQIAGYILDHHQHQRNWNATTNINTDDKKNQDTKRAQDDKKNQDTKRTQSAITSPLTQSTIITSPPTPEREPHEAEAEAEPRAEPETNANAADKPRLINLVQHLHDRLASMPTIEQLFLDISHLQRHIGKSDLKVRDRAIMQVNRIFILCSDTGCGSGSGSGSGSDSTSPEILGLDAGSGSGSGPGSKPKSKSESRAKANSTTSGPKMPDSNVTNPQQGSDHTPNPSHACSQREAQGQGQEQGESSASESTRQEQADWSMAMATPKPTKKKRKLELPRDRTGTSTSTGMGTSTSTSTSASTSSRRSANPFDLLMED